MIMPLPGVEAALGKNQPSDVEGEVLASAGTVLTGAEGETKTGVSWKITGTIMASS